MNTLQTLRPQLCYDCNRETKIKSEDERETKSNFCGEFINQKKKKYIFSWMLANLYHEK